MKGQLIVRNGRSSERLTIFWRQDKLDTEILLNAALGAPVAKLVSQDGVHYVELPGKPPQYGFSIKSLLYDLTGLKLPVSELVSAFEMNSEQLATEILAGAWQVTIIERDAQNRPIRLTASGEGIDIVLKVTEWR